MADKPEQELSAEEIARRRDAAIKRALNTPPTPTKELIGKTERAQSQAETRTIRRRKRQSSDSNQDER